MPTARQTARTALERARARRVDEPAIAYEGRRYTETELRQLQAAGQLDTLGALAEAAGRFLAAVDNARNHPDPDNQRQLFLVTDPEFPAGVVYQVPADWRLFHIQLCYVDAASDSER